MACINDVMTLSCTSDKNITVTRAQWGKYDAVCSDDCCQPDTANDCTVDMETTEPDLFAYIKSQCDGEQSCDLTYVAYVVNECEEEYFADYEQVFYDCSIVNLNIGFSAKLSITQSVEMLQIVPFDDVISNFGGHYSTSSYKFTCPLLGAYMFSITINQYDHKLH